MPTLKDIIADSYDIYLKEDKYFCVPKYGMIQEGFNYEMRDITELDFEVNARGRRDFNNNIIVAASTASFSFDGSIISST